MRGEDVGGNRKDALIRHACGVTPSPRGGVGKASCRLLCVVGPSFIMKRISGG